MKVLPSGGESWHMRVCAQVEAMDKLVNLTDTLKQEKKDETQKVRVPPLGCVSLLGTAAYTDLL